MTTPTSWAEVLEFAGFNSNVRKVLLDVNRENLAFHDMEGWHDEEVDDLIRTLRKTQEPTGQLCYVQVGAIENLKTIAYVCRHHARAARTATIPLFSRSFLARWKAERKLESNYKDLDELPKLTKPDDGTILDFIEEFPEKLAQITGTDGRPLGYVIRENEIPPLAVDDPLFGEPNCRYPSVRDEVIARAPIGVQGGRAYSADNKHVFEILRDAIADHEEVKVWIKGFVRAKDGRGAWAAFKAHYLGTSQLDNIAERADLKIETCVYTGEKTRYSFETHVSIFKKAHLDLQKAGNEPDGRTKVRKFLQSIKAPELQTAVGVARSQDKYLTDFEETINYLRRFVLPTSNNRTVASVGARGNQPPQQPPGLTYRWYKKDEFRALPKEHQAWLSYEKKRRDQANKDSGKKEKKKIKAAVRKEKRKLAKLQAKTEKESKKAKQSGTGKNDIETDDE
jgi:hypothetical protein